MEFFLKTKVSDLKVTICSEKNRVSNIEFCFQKLTPTALKKSKVPPQWRSLAKCLCALVECESAPSKKLLSEMLKRLDLDRMTAFQQKVYQTAMEIPRGKVLSYGELAKKMGCPGGARAVGQALRRNPFPLLIPCHRVIASDGKLGGFAGRSQMDSLEILVKKKLLQFERTH